MFISHVNQSQISFESNAIFPFYAIDKTPVVLINTKKNLFLNLGYNFLQRLHVLQVTLTQATEVRRGVLHLCKCQILVYCIQKSNMLLKVYL